MGLAPGQPAMRPARPLPRPAEAQSGLLLGAPSSGPGGPQANPPLPAELGAIADHLPRRIRTHATRRVELRLPRALFTEQGIAVPGPNVALRADFGLSRAVTMRLTSAGRRLSIEPRAAETVWIIPGGPEPDGGELVWRWDMTGLEPGRTRMHVTTTVRTITPDGSSAEAPVFDKVADVRVTPRYARRIGTVVTVLFAIAGGAAAGALGHAFAEPITVWVLALLER